MDRKSISRIAMLRRSRAMVTSRRLWKTRLVFWLGAITIGVFSTAFAYSADYAHRVFTHLDGLLPHHTLPLLLTPAAFVMIAVVTRLYFPGAQGSGIPQAIAARQLRDDPDRGGLLFLKIAFGKVLLTLLGLACGASIGREGPTVQVGAAIMMKSGRLGGMVQRRGLILAGSAAGIAAAFNTPLAGIVFAIEEMSRSYQVRTNGVVLSAVILAGIAAVSILGTYTYFGVSSAMATDLWGWLTVVACGLAGGLTGAIFSRSVIQITRAIRRWSPARPMRRVVIVSLVAGIVTAVIGFLMDGETFGTGYDQARAVVEGQAQPPLYFLGKLIATLAATVSGIPGGLFAPSLSVGAGLGSSIALLMGSQVALAALVGMAAYFAAVTQAPMTAFVIIFEMTGNHDAFGPIMIAAMLGYGTSRFIAPEPLYHVLSRLFIADAIRGARRAENARREEEGETVVAPSKG
ncbi:chloride channel protein [Thioclava atlantica]|uniref:Chloride channel protein n=1 Tax=Thioclava atlantica TaxID=1317124 RepID=A0A085TUN1_9RHOB|nr:chloride channel protein [Thioclava atlantica]KFE34428.1 chloride channel protein [Thioclava atlantica]